jgi:hypothetical protein
MRNLLAFLAAALITFLGLGWYLEWYKVSSTPASDGHREVHIDINTNKIGQDLDKGEKKVRDALGKKSKADQSSGKGSPSATAKDAEAGNGAPEDQGPAESDQPPKGSPPAPLLKQPNKGGEQAKPKELPKVPAPVENQDSLIIPMPAKPDPARVPPPTP